MANTSDMVSQERVVMPWIILSLVFLAEGCSTIPTTFTPAEPIPAGEFSNRLLSRVLEAHVSQGVVDYPAIQLDDRLPAYLTGSTPTGLPRAMSG